MITRKNKVLTFLGILLIPFLIFSQTAFAASQGTVVATSLNVRAAADISGKVIRLVHKGDTFDIIQTLNNWDQIKLSNDNVGWVCHDYLVPAKNIKATVKTNVLNVRDQPNVSSKIVGRIKWGTKITIQLENKGWGKIVTSSGVEGWVNEFYIEKSGEQTKLVLEQTNRVKQINLHAGQPKQSVQQPKTSMEQPKQSTVQPKTSVEQPEQPDLGAGQPKKSVEQPKTSMEQPKQSTVQPKTNMEQPEQPDLGTVQPKTSVEQPEQPDLGAEQPKQSVEQPKTSMEQPKQSTVQPKTNVEQPEQPDLGAGQPTSTQEQPNPSVEQPTPIQEQPISQGLLKGRTIVLDPGHGGMDPGTKSLLGAPEKTLTLETAKVVEQKLEEAGATVILTRTDDTYISLPQRAEIANQNHADAFISFHFNWSNDPMVNGLDAFYYQTAKDSKLAADLLNEIIKATNLKSAGTSFNNLSVLRNNSQPCTLIELGFVSNKQENIVVESPAFKENVAQGVYQGLLDYFSAP